MKKILLFLVLMSSGMYAQNNDYSDFTEGIKAYDISGIWTLEEFVLNSGITFYRKAPFGFIGENYQRFEIHFISATKNTNKKLEYSIYGKTRVKGIIRSFQGKIIITEAKVKDYDFGKKKIGFAKGTYEFFEDQNQKLSGKLEGNFRTNFYIDENDQIKYDDLLFNADDFWNNEFYGTWTSYMRNKSKRCNWGDYRIPKCGTFDVGIDHFIPSEQYKEFGWENYMKAYIGTKYTPEVLEAQKKEREKWWMD